MTEEKALANLRSQMITHADTIGHTFGPKGGNVLIQPKNGQAAFFARDGATVVKHLRAKDLGAALLADACNATVTEAGDGTTSTALLVRECLVNNINPGKYIDQVLNTLDELSFPADKHAIKNVALSVARNPDIAEMLSDIIWRLGPDGLIKPERGAETKAYVKEGYSLGTGALTQAMVSPPQIPKVQSVNEQVTLTDPLIIIIEEKISDHTLLDKVYEAYRRASYISASRTYKYPLLIIAADISGHALNGMVANLHHNPAGLVPIFAVKSPSGGMQRMDMLKDVEFITGAPIYSKHSGNMLKNFNGTFGTADSVELSMKDTIIIKQKIDLSERIASIKANHDIADKNVQERISKLQGAVGVVTFGPGLYSHLRNIELQVEDVVLACQKALQTGYIQGGKKVWLALAEAVPELKDVFTPLADRLPSGDAYDSVTTVKAAVRYAFTLVDQIDQTGTIIDNLEYE
jgi:chaperonin GroEL (HSP60 family)